MDLTLILIWTLFFVGLLEAVKLAWRVGLGKRSHLAPAFASYIVSTVHGCVAIVLTITALVSATQPWHIFDGDNHVTHNTAFTASLGYFIADTIAYVLPYGGDETLVFTAHHIGTALYLLASLDSQKGGHPVALGLLVGELTNPVFHVYNLLNESKDWRPRSHAMFNWWAPLFAGFFLIVRTIIGVPLMVWWCSQVVGLSDVPLSHRGMWIFACVGITAVSQLFMVKYIKHAAEVLKEKKKKVDKEEEESEPAGTVLQPSKKKTRVEESIVKKDVVFDSAEDILGIKYVQ